VKLRAVPIAVAMAAVLALAPAAAAHVTLNPPEWEAGGFARFAIRVPNEQDAAATTRITVKFPEQILSASFQPIEGWRREVKMVELDEPIEIEGEQVAERIDTVTWSGGRIEPGEFEEFGVSFQTPEEPGSELAFPAVQRYSDGDVVRWIGPPDSEEPAPVVAILEPAAEEGAAAATPAPTPAQSGGSGEADEESGGSDTLSIVALIVAAAALATALAALLGRRRRQPQRLGGVPTGS
jgi:MYXO-CTERM domain-containing protein